MKVQYVIEHQHDLNIIKEKLISSKLSNLKISCKPNTSQLLFKVSIPKTISSDLPSLDQSDPIMRGLAESIHTGVKIETALMLSDGDLFVGSSTLKLIFNSSADEYKDALVTLFGEYAICLFQYVFERSIAPEEVLVEVS